MMPNVPPKPHDERGPRSGPSPDLLAEGWTRRHVADPDRTREAVELYTSMGYEVKLVELTPDNFGPACGQCAAVLCRSCVLIYTRKKEHVRGRDTMSSR